MQECVRSEVREIWSGSSSARAPVLDPEVLGTLRELLPGSEVDSIYRAFVRHTEERIATFRSSCDAATAAREAHSLRGSAGMLGALALASVADTLEKQMSTGESLREHADALEDALAGFTAALAAAGLCL